MSGNGAVAERERVRIFVYGPFTALEGCRREGAAEVRGTLFDIAGEYPALMLAGTDRVAGEVWLCPPERIDELDGYEAVVSGRFRRVGVEVEGRGCWTYVAGPALAARLRPERRIATGRWSPEEENA